MHPTGRTTLYRLFAADGTLLYVGISIDVTRRWATHAARQPWWDDVDRFEVQQFSTRSDARKAEAEAIATERPRWNIQGIPKRPYMPPSRLRDAVGRYTETEKALIAATERLKARLVQEMHRGAPATVLAEIGPWTYETVRVIAREAGVPRLREPTVRSVKPRRRGKG